MFELVVKKKSISGCELVNMLKKHCKITKKLDVEQGFKAFYVEGKKELYEAIESNGYKWAHAPYTPVGVTIMAKIHGKDRNDQLVVTHIWKKEVEKKPIKRKVKAIPISSNLLDNL